MGPRTLTAGSLPARLAAALGRLGCAPSEVLALALLAAAAVAGLGLLWWAGRAPAGEAAPPAAGEAAPPATAPAGASDGPLDVRDATVVVHVAGRVAAPGLYELPGGARVADALEAAGGALPDALLDHVNLARTLRDGEQLRVPGPDDLPAGPDTPGAPGPGEGHGPPAWRPDGTLDLNLATGSDLEELPGIGPVLAERIVTFRDDQGGFTSVGQLREIEGIGERTFQRLAELVTV